MHNKYRQQNSKERRREKGKDEREGMRGYLQTLPPSLTAVPNGKTLLVPLASLRFMSLFYFLCVFSVFFFLFLHLLFFPFYYHFFHFIFVLLFLFFFHFFCFLFIFFFLSFFFFFSFSIFIIFLPFFIIFCFVLFSWETCPDRIRVGLIF